MAPNEADGFARSVTECRLFLLFPFIFSAVHKCNTLLTYNGQTLLDIATSNSSSQFTGFIFLELQLIVRTRNHHPREGQEAPSPTEHADPRTALRRQRRKWGKRGGLHARLKARASRPPLPSLLLANMRSLENKLDELRARITTQREMRECCALIFTETFWRCPGIRRSVTDTLCNWTPNCSLW